ncbi:MAG TPA: SCO family protein [Pseudogracilibacillus sp.]|nr:SCO family protein [Pseudogracilibacillus sp.]
MKQVRLLILVLSVLFIAACGGDDYESKNVDPNLSDNVGNFSGLNEAGEEFSVADLQGHWWVADFIFTNCTTVCLPMTSNMVTLQGMLEDEGLDDVKLLSFSVDPDNDTPEVLTDYANEYGADLNRWTFLTGYDFETIQNYSLETFKSLVDAPDEGDDQVEHGTRFFLIDPEGNIKSHYSGMNSEELEAIVNDIKNFQ